MPIKLLTQKLTRDKIATFTQIPELIKTLENLTADIATIQTAINSGAGGGGSVTASLPLSATAVGSAENVALVGISAFGTPGQAPIVNPTSDGMVWGGTQYQNAGATTISVGGIASGSTFPTSQTVQQMFDAMLYPYQAPSIFNLTITGVPPQIEVGTSFGPSVTFTWSTTNSGNVSPNTIGLTDITLSTTIASGLPNTGSSAQTLPAAVTRTTAGTHLFGISGTNTHGGTFSTSLVCTWSWRIYFGTQTAASLTAAHILALAGGQLTTGTYPGTYSMGATGYKYICLADAAGGQLNSVKDQSTGFNVPMNTGTFTDGGGFGYEKVSVTNGPGVTTLVRVYRTLNNLGGAVTLVVT